MRRFRRLLPSPRTTRGKLGIFAFLTIFLVLASTTAGYAFWQSSVSTTSTVSAANLTISTTNLTGYTFGNDTLVSTGSITAQNSTVTPSTRTAAVTLTLGQSGSSTLASKVQFQAWTTTSAANCTATATVPGSGVTTAYWSAGATLSTSLAPQASAIYCVRSTIATRESVATSSGALTFTPQVSGTITLGNFSGSATATATQSTQYIYPAFTGVDTTHWTWIRPNFENASYNYCLDVSGAATTAGTIVISYGCKNAGVSNQQWKFTASGSGSYYTITPRNTQGLRIDNQSSSSNGGGIIVDTAGTPATSTDQQWQLQQVSAGVYEFVSGYSGLCLTSPGGSSQNLGQMSQAPCNGSQYQQFLISQAFENFTCATANNSWTWSWTTATTGPYHVLATHGNTTTEIATTAASASGATVAYSTPTTWGVGSYNVSFVDANGTLVGSGTLTVAQNSRNNSCTASEMQ